MTRTFTDRAAVRESVQLLIGLIGPSGGGKTLSALRLATGIQRVAGGEIYYIDSEAKRALHYAFDPETGKGFKFRHLPFEAPFGPLDYLAAIEHCVAKGAKTIVIDSMSHEHEGPGGVLEMHAEEIPRLVRAWNSTPDRVKMSAWAKPKAERRRLLNSIVQLECNFIFCFRAKEKLKVITGKPPVPLGWVPIAGEEFVYEMTCRMLLPPNANGVPQWETRLLGEQSTVKKPQQFEGIFRKDQPLSEDIGQQMAEWAAGKPGKPSSPAAGPVLFSSRLAWEGKEAFGGTPLSEAGPATLKAYRKAVASAQGDAKVRQAKTLGQHLVAIDEALKSAKEPEPEHDDEPPLGALDTDPKPEEASR
jgi:hypothetical protein